jgi:hypothetical protein
LLALILRAVKTRRHGFQKLEKYARRNATKKNKIQSAVKNLLYSARHTTIVPESIAEPLRRDFLNDGVIPHRHGHGGLGRGAGAAVRTGKDVLGGRGGADREGSPRWRY